MRRITGLISALVTVVMLSACRHTSPAPQDSWTQGYETQTGGYMQPDHGFLYYWFMYHILFSNQQPTYHVYVPPAGYTGGYRPWMAPSQSVFYKTPEVKAPKPTTSPRTGGGFSDFVTPKSTTKVTSPRTTGGFGSTYKAPTTKSSGTFRSSGGFGKR